MTKTQEARVAEELHRARHASNGGRSRGHDNSSSSGSKDEGASPSDSNSENGEVLITGGRGVNVVMEEVYEKDFTPLSVSKQADVCVPNIRSHAYYPTEPIFLSPLVSKFKTHFS
jgi:hypothetical protein